MTTLRHTIRNLSLSLVLLLSAIAPSCPRAVFAQGTTVIGGLGPGLGQSVNPFSADWVRQQTIATLSQQADNANANAAATYLLKAQDWLTNALRARDAGQAIPTIADAPLKIHVDPKTGAQTSGPDSVAQKPVLPAASGVPSTGLIANPNAPPDRTDQLLSGMAAMYSLVSQMQAELLQLKAKLGIQ